MQIVNQGGSLENNVTEKNGILYIDDKKYTLTRRIISDDTQIDNKPIDRDNQYHEAVVNSLRDAILDQIDYTYKVGER